MTMNLNRIQKAIILAGVILFLYFFWQQNDLKMQEKCRTAGEKAYNADKKDYSDVVLFEPRYGFNRKLNTCLYSSGYEQGDFWERWIKDSFTNKQIEVLMYFKDMDQENFKRRADEYWRKHAELFGDWDTLKIYQNTK